MKKLVYVLISVSLLFIIGASFSGCNTTDDFIIVSSRLSGSESALSNENGSSPVSSDVEKSTGIETSASEETSEDNSSAGKSSAPSSSPKENDGWTGYY